MFNILTMEDPHFRNFLLLALDQAGMILLEFREIPWNQ